MSGTNRLGILGAGSWGTALAITLARRFNDITLWTRSEDRAKAIEDSRINQTFLPAFVLPDRIRVTAKVSEAVSGCSHVLLAIPSHSLRETAKLAKEFIGSAVPVISATKGLDEQTLQTMSQVIAEVLGNEERVAVLSGPTFAREVAAGEPTAVVIAARDIQFAQQLQRIFATENFRLYTTEDVTGVEIGAALKNVIAIGAGICQGLGLGANSVAALVTRGLAEITRLAVSLGGNARTLSGLAGLGDLVLTATGDLSRNRHVGIELGRGRKLPDILESMCMVAEGVRTSKAAFQLGMREKTPLPIVGEMYKVLYEGKDPKAAIRELMDRPLTAE